MQLINILGMGEGVIGGRAPTAETTVRIARTAGTTAPSPTAGAWILDNPAKVSIRAPTRHDMALILLSMRKVMRPPP